MKPRLVSEGNWRIQTADGYLVGARNRVLGTGIALLVISVPQIVILGWVAWRLLVKTLNSSAHAGNGQGLAGAWLFLAVLLICALVQALFCLACFFGRTEVRVAGGIATVFTGIGFFGVKRSITVNGRCQVESLTTYDGESGSYDYLAITNEHDRKVTFGRWVPDERRHILLRDLKAVLSAVPKEEQSV